MISIRKTRRSSKQELMLAVISHHKNSLVINGSIASPDNPVFSKISHQMNIGMSASAVYEFITQSKVALAKHVEWGVREDEAKENKEPLSDSTLLQNAEVIYFWLVCFTGRHFLGLPYFHGSPSWPKAMTWVLTKMAFPRSGKTQRTWSLDSMRQALQAVDSGMSIRSSAELYGIPRNTLTTYVASELRLEDEMKFMENFDPEKSKREQRKLNRKFSNLTVRRTVYDDKGTHVKTGLDLCDCLNDQCEGCFFACAKCRSLKCGHECRQNRRWMYESHTIQGMDEMIQNQYLDH